MNQYHLNPAMEALVRSAVLAEQMNKKRPAVDQGVGPEKKIPRITENLNVTNNVAAQAPTKQAATKPATKRGSKKSQKEQFSFPVEPRVVAVIKKPRTIMNHSYRDFSQVPAELDYEKPTSIEEMTLSEKVHDVLSIKEYAPFVSWMVHGRAFRVQIPKIFEEQICPKYFGHSRYSSFLRLLNNHGFKHISQGPDRNCYYHECFLRGMPHLCKYMPKSKNARHLVPDPDNEPDFYKLSKLYPLGDQEEEIIIPVSTKKRTPALPRDPPSRPAPATVPAARAAVPKPQKRCVPPASITTVASLPTAPRVAAAVPASNVALLAAQPEIAALLHRQRLLSQHQAAITAEQQAAIENNALLNAALRSRFAHNPRGWGAYPF